MLHICAKYVLNNLVHIYDFLYVLCVDIMNIMLMCDSKNVIHIHYIYQYYVGMVRDININ